ncbi:cache domain-containing protein [Pseudodesulfovibrio sp. S3-i]|uniref:cache domain-containing protein n=1 Tax=Pseudodesulfovibrio sp. S3-i TaxID=2929474 RepID=UPI001FB8A8BC|nr:cache domain-containing protein [Pseudodesulfovibrio sp. S3-i]MCJ2166285.1 cache domain-containing protein [Pseudodesulfovibrio sp. S3-i]
MPCISGRVAAAVCLAVVLLVSVGTGVHGESRVVRADIKLVVQVAATGLGGLIAGVESRSEQIRLIQDFVKSSRFFPDKDGYFYVYDTKGVCIAHGVQPQLVGRSLIDFKDKSGFAVIQAIVEAGKAGGGYVEFYWHRPGAQGTFNKLGYVEMIPSTDFVIGSGLYYIDIR